MKKNILLSALCLALITGCNKTGELVQQAHDDSMLDVEQLLVESDFEEESTVESENITEPTQDIVIEENRNPISTDGSDLDFTFNFEGLEQQEEVQQEETIISMYVDGKLVTMPLIISDLERQSMSVNYERKSNHSVVSDIFGFKKSSWVSVADIQGSNIIDVYTLSESERIITNNDKVIAIASNKPYAEFSYFGINAGSTNYNEAVEIMKKLGFNSVRYTTFSEIEYMVGTININDNKCQVWVGVDFSGDENGVVDEIFIVNTSLLDSSTTINCTFKSDSKGDQSKEEASNMPFSFNGVDYSYSSTIVDYDRAGWGVADIISSESGGQTHIKLQKGNVIIDFYTSSLYLEKTGSHFNIMNTCVPTKVVFDKEALNNINFMGITGVCSVNKLKDLPISQFMKSDELRSDSSDINIPFGSKGSVSISVLDGYVDGLTFNYMR